MRAPEVLAQCVAIIAAIFVLAACNVPPAARNEAATAPAPKTLPAPASAPVTPGRIVSWDAVRDGDPHTYNEGGLRITLHGKANPDGVPSPVIRIEAPGAPAFEYEGVAGLSNPAAAFAVGRFDPRSDGLQVMFAAYSGGAHCCTDLRFLILAGGRWTTVEAGEWDGDGISEYPTDLDGDGALDFRMFDGRFDYAFGSHADSRVPPRIYNLTGGQWVDVSSRPGFAPVFERDMAAMRTDCEAHSNPACAVYVADAARLGRYQEAWTFMLAHYDRNADWELPDGCRITPAQNQACPEAQKIQFTEFPAALEYFLHDLGYTAR